LSIATPRNASLTDIIGAGYRALNRRPWVIVIPAGLSLYLWVGAPLVLGPLASELGASLSELVHALGEDSQQQELIENLLLSDLRLVLAWLNFVPVFAPPLEAGADALSLRQPWQLAGLTLLINLLALLLSSYFLTLLSEAVSGERRAPQASLRQAIHVAGQIMGYLLVLLGVGSLLALPFLALSTIVIFMLPGATLLILLAWYVALFWAYIYTGFAPEAILMSRAGPLRAIYHSVNLVRRNMTGTLGLLLLSYLIISGMSLIWRQIAVSPSGLVIAILASAYIGSGLAAARLEFYRQRWERKGQESGAPH
jgi:hypothetical protein